MVEEPITFNGLNGATGNYLLPDLTVHDVATIARGDKLDEAHLTELEDRYSHAAVPHLGVKAGVDPTCLDQTGWGVIFAFDDDTVEQCKDALKPLLELRHQQAGDLYKEFDGVDAVRRNDSKLRWLERQGVGPGPAEPTMVPYYLLIVASPETIPYRFQYQLNVSYAVGRIHFAMFEEYACYAESVVAAEERRTSRSRKVTFFGVRNPGDRATNMSATQLVKPLADSIDKAQPSWQIEVLKRDHAKKADLAEVLSREDGPALLFTASHGMGFPKGDERQSRHQGALLCQDWPGPLQWIGKSIPEEYYFSADDLTQDSQVAGLVTFIFACYSAGTPLLDDFAHKAFKERIDIADKPFIARLPIKLLTHPKGGALAVIGHVERAWGFSFSWPGAGSQIGAFESTILSLLSELPVGAAMEFFSERYAELSTELTLRQFDDPPNDIELAYLWTANNDNRSYVIIGDPAVRLAVE